MTHTDTKSTDRKQWDSQDSKSSVLIQVWKGQSHAYIKNGYACVDQKRHFSWKLRDSAPFLRYKDWGGDTRTPDIRRSYFQVEPTGKYETWERAMDAYTIHKVSFLSDPVCYRIRTTEPVSCKNMETVLSSSYTRQPLPQILTRKVVGKVARRLLQVKQFQQTKDKWPQQWGDGSNESINLCRELEKG